MQIGVQLLVRTVIRAANHIGDAEVDVVDDAREMKRRRAVAPPERHALEDLLEAGSVGRREVALGPLALPDRAVVPGDPEPAEIGLDRLLAAGDVPRRVGVVDPQQQVVAEAAVRDGAQRVADVQCPGRAGREPDASHGPSLPGPAPRLAFRLEKPCTQGECASRATLARVRWTIAVGVAVTTLVLAGGAPATALLPLQRAALKAVALARAANHLDAATAASGAAEITRAAKLIRNLPASRARPLGRMPRPGRGACRAS